MSKKKKLTVSLEAQQAIRDTCATALEAKRLPEDILRDYQKYLPDKCPDEARFWGREEEAFASWLLTGNKQPSWVNKECLSRPAYFDRRVQEIEQTRLAQVELLDGLRRSMTGWRWWFAGLIGVVVIWLGYQYLASEPEIVNTTVSGTQQADFPDEPVDVDDVQTELNDELHESAMRALGVISHVERLFKEVRALEQRVNPADARNYRRLYDPSRTSDEFAKGLKVKAHSWATVYLRQPDFVDYRNAALSWGTTSATDAAKWALELADAKSRIQEAVRVTRQDELTEEDVDRVQSVVEELDFGRIKEALEAQEALLKSIEEWGTGQSGGPIAGAVAVNLRELLEEVVKVRRWRTYGVERALWIVSRDLRFREALAPLASRDLVDGSLNYAGFDETKATYLLSTGHQAFTSTLGRHRAFETVVIHCNKRVGWLEEDFFSIQDKLLAAREAFPEVFGPGSKIPGSPKTVWPLQKVVDVVVPRNRELFIPKDELHDAARRDYVSKHGGIRNKVLYWAELPVPNQHLVKWVEKPTYPFPGEPLPLNFETYGLDRGVYEE